MKKLTQIQIRIEEDLNKQLQEMADNYKVKKTHILKGILKSHIYGKKKIIITVRHKEIMSARKVLRMKSKLENNEDLSAEYISKLTRLNNDEYNNKRNFFIEHIIRNINADLDDMEPSIDRIELEAIRDAFIKKDDEEIKKLCHYNLRKWKYILTGKLLPNKLEVDVLEERLKEKIEKVKKLKSGNNNEMGLKK